MPRLCRDQEEATDTRVRVRKIEPVDRTDLLLGGSCANRGKGREGKRGARGGHGGSIRPSFLVSFITDLGSMARTTGTMAGYTPFPPPPFVARLHRYDRTGIKSPRVSPAAAQVHPP